MQNPYENEQTLQEINIEVTDHPYQRYMSVYRIRALQSVYEDKARILQLCGGLRLQLQIQTMLEFAISRKKKRGIRLVRFENEISLTDSYFECVITAAGTVGEAAEVWGNGCNQRRWVTRKLLLKALLCFESALISLLLWLQ